MPTLLLSNTTSPTLVARPEDIPADVLPYYEAWADRLLWTLDADDVAVVPGPLKAGFLRYMCEVLEIDRGSLQVLSLRDQPSSSWHPRHHRTLLADLRARMAALGPGDEWTIASYIRDREIVEWEGLLVAEGPPMDAFTENVAELVNTKSVFRCVARAVGTPIARGRIATRGDELVDVVEELIAVTGAVIVKQDQNSGGDGNVVVTRDGGISGQGASRIATVQGAGRSAVARALETGDLHRRALVPGGCSPAKYVVEVYHPRSSSYYVEVEVPRHGPARVRTYGGLRMTPLWSGFEIPTHDLSANERDRLLEHSLGVAEAAQSLGYSGLMNIDSIVTPEGDIIVNEFNGRAGGASHLHDIFQRLVGPSYLDEVALVTRNAVPCSGFDDLRSALDASGTSFDSGARSGVIVLQDNTDETGTIEYVSVGATFADALQHESKLEQALEAQT